MGVKLGELRNRITLQREDSVTNALGEVVGSGWVDVANVRAKLTNQLSATAEAVASGGHVNREQVRFDILARNVEAGWRIVHKGKVYDIKSVGTDNVNRVTSIIAVSGANDG